MKKSRNSDEQIVRILREADKDPVPDLARNDHAIPNRQEKYDVATLTRKRGLVTPTDAEHRAVRTAPSHLVPMPSMVPASASDNGAPR
jgi:hypothetical protein